VKLFSELFLLSSARSPVFYKMFAHDYKECREGEMTGISKDGFREFLHFMNTSEVDNLAQHVKELLIASDKYEVDDLKAICSTHMLTNLTEENANEFFQCAHKYNCDVDLKKASFELIKKSIAKCNYVLPDEFIEAPGAVDKLLMMKMNFEDGLKVEVAQAEKISKRSNDNDDSDGI
jgi:hypothetical protein